MKYPLLLTPALLLVTALMSAQGQSSQAQTSARTTITLPAAVASALSAGSTVRDAQTGVASSTSTLKAVLADPSTLASALLSAQQAQAQLSQARLTATQNAINAFTALYQTQEQTEVQALQIQVDSKALQVAQVKLSTRNGTALDVQNTLSTSRQNLQDTQAQLLVNSQKLANVIGKPGSYTDSTSPNASPVRQNTSLSSNYPTLLRDQQAVDTAALSVRLADNEFTARVTLDQARTALSNAQSTAEAAQASYQTALQTEANTQATYKQDGVRLSSGTISAVALQQSQLTLKKAQYARAQALVAVWQALAALSTASGQNVTGLVK